VGFVLKRRRKVGAGCLFFTTWNISILTWIFLNPIWNLFVEVSWNQAKIFLIQSWSLLILCYLTGCLIWSTWVERVNASPRGIQSWMAHLYSPLETLNSWPDETFWFRPSIAQAILYQAVFRSRRRPTVPA
jgi:hypothetical protein